MNELDHRGNRVWRARVVPVMMRGMGTRLRVWAAAAAIAAASAGCAALPLLAGPQPSPTVLAVGVAVGSAVPCEDAAMRARCDDWIAAARDGAGVAAADLASAEVHVGWSTVPRTMDVRIVVALSLRDGSTVFQPIYCGAPDPTLPPDVCDYSGLSLPPR